ncbi:MAG: hypothetical protein JST68_03155 [Bacteroidetes bacterium]|nr:hypothetical protein [Bacteroidota bacterium]
MKILSLLLIGCLVYGASRAQDSVAIYISRIRAEYQRINSMSLKKVRVEEKNEASEGGEVFKYYSGDSLMKMTSSYMGAIGRQGSDYYFSGGELVFELVTDYHYDGYMTGKIKRKEENRYYFYRRKLIRWINEKGKIVNKKLYAEKEKELLKNDLDLK